MAHHWSPIHTRFYDEAVRNLEIVSSLLTQSESVSRKKINLRIVHAPSAQLAWTHFRETISLPPSAQAPGRHRIEAGQI